MSLTLIIDDTAPVADDIVGLTGVNRFGNLIFQRRRLVQRLRDVAAEAGLPEPILADRRDRLAELGEKLAHDRTGGYFLLFPTHVVAQAPRAELVRFLRQLAYTQTGLQVTVTTGRACWWCRRR
jgi:hypothetical protein